MNKIIINRLHIFQALYLNMIIQLIFQNLLLSDLKNEASVRQKKQNIKVWYLTDYDQSEIQWNVKREMLWDAKGQV